MTNVLRPKTEDPCAGVPLPLLPRLTPAPKFPSCPRPSCTPFILPPPPPLESHLPGEKAPPSASPAFPPQSLDPLLSSKTVLRPTSPVSSSCLLDQTISVSSSWCPWPTTKNCGDPTERRLPVVVSISSLSTPDGAHQNRLGSSPIPPPSSISRENSASSLGHNDPSSVRGSLSRTGEDEVFASGPSSVLSDALNSSAPPQASPSTCYQCTTSSTCRRRRPPKAPARWPPKTSEPVVDLLTVLPQLRPLAISQAPQRPNMPCGNPRLSHSPQSTVTCVDDPVQRTLLPPPLLTLPEGGPPSSAVPSSLPSMQAPEPDRLFAAVDSCEGQPLERLLFSVHDGSCDQPQPPTCQLELLNMIPRCSSSDSNCGDGSPPQLSLRPSCRLLARIGRSIVHHRYSNAAAPEGGREPTRLRGLASKLLPRPKGCPIDLPLTYVRHLCRKANGGAPARYSCRSEASCPFTTDSYLLLCCHSNFGHSVLVRLAGSKDSSIKRLQEATKFFYPVLATSLEPSLWKFACTLCPLQFTHLTDLNDHLSRLHGRTPIRRCEAQASLKCFSCGAETDRNQRLRACGLDLSSSRQEDVRDQILQYLISDPARALNAHGLAVFMLLPNEFSRILLPSGSRLPTVHNPCQPIDNKTILLLLISSLYGRLRPLPAPTRPTGLPTVEGGERVPTGAADEHHLRSRDFVPCAVTTQFCDMDVSEPSSPSHNRSFLRPNRYSPLIPSKWPCPPPSLSLPPPSLLSSAESSSTPPSWSAPPHLPPPPPPRTLSPFSATGGPSPPVSLVSAKPVAGVLPNQAPHFDAGAPSATLSARPLLGQMPLPPRPVVFQYSHTQTLPDQGKDNPPKRKRCRSQAAKAKRPQATGNGSSEVVTAKHLKKLRTSSTDGSSPQTSVAATPISQAFLLANSEGTSSSPTFPLLCSLSAPSHLHSSYSAPACGGRHCVATTMTPQYYGNHFPPLLPWSGIRPNFQSPPFSSCQPDSQPHHQPLEEGTFTDQRFDQSSLTFTTEPPFPARLTAPSRAFCSAFEQPSAAHNAFFLLSSQSRLPGSICIQPPSDGTAAVCLPAPRPQFLSPALNGSSLMSYPPYSCAPLQLSAVRTSHGAGISSGETSHGPLSNGPSIASHVRYSQPPPIVVPTRALHASHQFTSNIAGADDAHYLSFQPIDVVPVTASSSLDWAGGPPARPVAIAPPFLSPSSAAPAWSARPRFPHPQTAPTQQQQHPSCSVPLQNSSSIFSALSGSDRHQSQRPPLNSVWTTTAMTTGLPTRLIETPGVTPRLPHPGSIPDCRVACGQGSEYSTLSGAQRLQSQFLHHTKNYLGTAPKAVPSASVTRAISSAPTVTSPHLLSLAKLQGGQIQGLGSSASQIHSAQLRPLLSGQNHCTEVAVTCAPPTKASVASQRAVCHWTPAGGQRPPQPSPPSRPQVASHELDVSQPLLPVGQVERCPTHSAGASKLMAMLLSPNRPRGDCPLPIVCPLCSFSDTSRQAVFKHFASAH